MMEIDELAIMAPVFSWPDDHHFKRLICGVPGWRAVGVVAMTGSCTVVVVFSPSSTHHLVRLEADDGGMVALDKVPWLWLAKEGRDGGINGTAKRGHVIARLSRIGWYFAET